LASWELGALNNPIFLEALVFPQSRKRPVASDANSRSHCRLG